MEILWAAEMLLALFLVMGFRATLRDWKEARKVVAQERMSNRMNKRMYCKRDIR